MSGLVEQNSKAQRSHLASLFNTLGEKGAEPPCSKRRATSCFTTCLLLFSESAQLMKYSEISPSYYRRMRYFPLSASHLPFCKFVHASIFQRFIRENCDREKTLRFRFNTCNTDVTRMHGLFGKKTKRVKR